MQKVHFIRASNVARCLIGLATVVVVLSKAQAQQYYYPATGASQPAYNYTQPTASCSSGYCQTSNAPQYYQYAPQYYQPAQAPQYYQAVQAQQYYQAAQAPQTTAEGAQVIPTSYTVPVAEATPTQPMQATAVVNYGGSDPYGFLSWLNATRASYGLGAVGYDASLSSWAAMNNNQQMAYGLGHFVMGPARRQNSAMGAEFPAATWMASATHRAALLDPTISWIGIAAAGAYWTFNAY
ncbi:MAG: hypothetical protein JO161_05135 [Planctomycetaceae bacterium]|nr:hypothetical protein [Planctomycetaceae bacterium]